MANIIGKETEGSLAHRTRVRQFRKTQLKYEIQKGL